MERLQKPPARRRYDYPSFSSSLLDSIYRSIDEDESKANREAPDQPPPPTSKKKQFHNITADSYNWAPPRSGAPEHIKKHTQAVTRPHLKKQNSQTYSNSSSDGSTYSGFSSSEPESATVRLKPIQTRPDSKRPPIAPTVTVPSEKKKRNLNNSIRSKLRELKKSQARSPASPAAKLAGFLNSLFTNSRKLRSTDNAAACSTHDITLKKTRGHSKMGMSSCQACEESMCSSASSYSRSCLAKTPSDQGAKRSVRFQLPSDIRDKKMMWQGFEEDEDDDMASDSSSDLFELDSLSVVGKYRNELPVYETTYLGRLYL